MKKFLKLVEIQTKVASIIPLLVGTLYTIYTYDTFNVINFIIMFISLISIDMMTTAVNNYMDYKTSIKKHGYNFEEHNAMAKYNLSSVQALVIIISLLLNGVIFGMLLVIRTDLIVLIIGIISTIIGITYSYGRLSINRTLLGEIVSSLFMGFLITFLSVYIHIYPLDLINIQYVDEILIFGINLKIILNILLVSLPLVFGIANIMLANNICDIEDDIENKRYTLVVYLGKKTSLKIFNILYYGMFVALTLTIVLGILPIYMYLVLLVYIPTKKLLLGFNENQLKQKTFVNAVKIFISFGITYIITLIISVIIKLFV